MHKSSICNAQQHKYRKRAAKLKMIMKTKVCLRPLATQRFSIWFTYFCCCCYCMRVTFALGQRHDSIDRLCRSGFSNRKCYFSYMKISKHVDFCAFRLMNGRQFGFVCVFYLTNHKRRLKLSAMSDASNYKCAQCQKISLNLHHYRNNNSL